MSTETMPPNASRQRGFTLTEVMVALLIIAIGALGIAKMQALALSSTGASRSRALAALEASSLADAMHINRTYWSAAAATPGTITVATTGGAATIASTNAGMAAALATVAGTTCPTSATMGSTLSCYCAATYSAPCSGTYINLAASDLYDWGKTLGSVLPTATATVTCNNADIPVDCIISITWTENAVSLTQQEGAAAAGNANTSAATTAAFQYVTYTLDVVP